ncbi:phospholipase A1-like [Anoplophora glabripennis]|uniref:phospholipase A1-like n=1 Tax=Anoplophora glabripennis TaxID=217634 RepID=UPI000873BEDB|nr:phospholipase A1-like [Anoplophora glabripennis]
MSRFIGVIFVFLLTLGAECVLDERLRLDFFNIYKHAAITTREIQQDPVTPDDVTFYLYTKNNSDTYIKLNERNLDLLHNKTIVFLIHGWINSKDVFWYEDVKNAFLKTQEDYYIVEVDWKKPAFDYYYVSSINTYDVAKIIARLIVNLNRNHGVSLDKVVVIGHSLGGQITGFVGKRVYKQTGQKLPRIIALDPAGPLFVQRPYDKRLNKHDAEVVEVIHTDGGTFGFEDATGTIDFFPNGGNSQPGCMKIDLVDITTFIDPIPCDHFRAGEYLTEAILQPNDFSARKCADWDSYKEGKCEDEEVTLGNLTTKSTGKFFLETNKSKPFAKHGSEKEGLINKLLVVFKQ